MEVDNFGSISDSEESMPGLEDLYGDIIFDDAEHQSAVQNCAGPAPLFLRPPIPILLNMMEDPRMEQQNHPPALNMEAAQMNFGQENQNHASAPTRPFVSVLNCEEELDALLAKGLEDLHRATIMELQQIQDWQDQGNDSNQSSLAGPLTPIQLEPMVHSSNEHPEVAAELRFPETQIGQISWDFDMDLLEFIPISHPLQKSDLTSSIRSVETSPQVQFSDKNQPGPAPSMAIPVTANWADQMSPSFGDDIECLGVSIGNKLPAAGYVSSNKNQSRPTTLMAKPVTPADQLPSNSGDDIECLGMFIGNKVLVSANLWSDENQSGTALTTVRPVTLTGADQSKPDFQNAIVRPGMPISSGVPVSGNQWSDNNQPGPAPPVARPVAPMCADQMGSSSQYEIVHPGIHTKNSVSVSGNLWSDKNQPGSASPMARLETTSSQDDIEYLGMSTRNKAPVARALPNPSNSQIPKGDPGPSPPSLAPMDINSPIPSPPLFTLPPEVNATDPQTRIKQLKELYLWQSNQNDIWKRKTDKVQAYCKKQYQENMTLQKELNTVNARLSLFGVRVSTPFSEVLKEWEQSEFNALTLDGIDLNHFLFNPKGVKTIPQVVRRPVNSYNLFRLHYHLKVNPEALHHEWKLMKFKSKDKDWHWNCQMIAKWQKTQELKGWIRPVRVRGDGNKPS